jgi:diguanylate cyclase (GGDEF)-like protein/PAS domain S-box-containing protein
MITAIFITIALFSAVSLAISISVTGRSKNQASGLEISARQRTLAERYVKEILLVRAGEAASPERTALVLTDSIHALLNGGTVPAMWGDDDSTVLGPATGSLLRSQFAEERRLITDLTASGTALLSGSDGVAVSRTHVHIKGDPQLRLQVLGTLTSNVSLNATRTLGAETDRNVAHLIYLQIVLGIVGLLISLLLAGALIVVTRRQTAHFRSLVTSSTDLVLVFGVGGCRYVSKSVTAMFGRSEEEMLGQRLIRFVHPDDQPLLEAAWSQKGSPGEIVFRMETRSGEWRHLEAHVTDLRQDRFVRGVVLNARDITERVRLAEELTHQAFHDSLTGLANRALFRDRLTQALARSARSADPLSVLLFDLDGFKQVNDTFGHDTGDQMLRRVGQLFVEVTRPSDTLARLGGDEFGILLEGADSSRGVAVAERLLAQLAEPVPIGDRGFSLSASIGIVVHPGGAEESELLINHADVALYAAKQDGRNRYKIFEDDMARELRDVLGFEQDLRLGLDRGEITVHYQPEIDLDTQSTVGVEALLRWHSPTRGEVPPVQFIPFAEGTSLIHLLGEFVLQEACKQTAEWRRKHLLPEGFVMWVNVSGKQLSDGGIATLVKKALRDTGLPANFLGLEMTETAIVTQGVVSDRVSAELQELHDKGVSIAIDDFGTGFSSIGHLRRFPVDLIKVDQSFVQGVGHNAKDTAITTSLASLAHALGVRAIAEGIESADQLRSVRELGCDLAQGFLFARPVSAHEMGKALAQKRDSSPMEEPVPA